MKFLKKKARSAPDCRARSSQKWAYCNRSRIGRKEKRGEECGVCGERPSKEIEGRTTGRGRRVGETPSLPMTQRCCEKKVVFRTNRRHYTQTMRNSRRGVLGPPPDRLGGLLRRTYAAFRPNEKETNHDRRDDRFPRTLSLRARVRTLRRKDPERAYPAGGIGRKGRKDAASHGARASAQPRDLAQGCADARARPQSPKARPTTGHTASA